MAFHQHGMNEPDRVELGRTGLSVGAVGQGTNSWKSDPGLVGQLRSSFQAAVEAGVDFFDTAEVYGSGSSERALGSCLRESPGAVVVASKFFPMPWRFGPRALIRALRGSLSRLGLQRLDLYMVHFPTPLVRPETWMAGMAGAVAEGLIGAVGVSNYGPERLRRARDVLATRGIALACNEVELSLLSRAAEKDGLLELCRTLGVTVIAYRPLALGTLTGHQQAGGRKGWRQLLFGRSYACQAGAISGLLREIGQAHGGKTPSQVALNWVICKGALPIPGARSAAHVRENAGAMGWRLAVDEIAAVDAATDGL